MPMTKHTSRRLSLRRWSTNAEMAIAYTTRLGIAVVGRSEDVLASRAGKAMRGRIQLVFTSPPFALHRKKKYGNSSGEEFKRWLAGYAKPLGDLLSPDGSIVIEMGNAWEPGIPVMSTLALESLLEFKKQGAFYLCQEFIWHNSARLPSPAQWVTVERIRVKDSFTRLWWLSRVPKPKADNRRVLTPYTESMKKLLTRKSYNAGLRPSEHRVSPNGFLTNHGGAIPPSVIQIPPVEPESLLIGSNTGSSDDYHKYCKARGVTPHPARMPIGLASFFIKLCTDEGDTVLDPFAGSNTTGAAAERLGRQWISIEANPEYAAHGIGRFPSLTQARG